MSRKMNCNHEFSVGIDSPFGIFVAVFTQKGLKRLIFPGIKLDTLQPARWMSENLLAYKEWIVATESGITAHLAGDPSYNLPPLDISDGTVFQQNVWKELLKIPWGKTKTYGEIAHKLGNPKLARAVGAACGANPIPIFIPCHRVVSSDGSLGGFSAGLKWKKLLLEIESNIGT